MGRKLNRVFIDTLGCPKNSVDSNVLRRALSDEDFEVVDTMRDAEIWILNTCAFIADARAESVEAISEMISAKKKGKVEAIVVTGCFAEKSGETLIKEMPEIDVVIGNRDMEEIPHILRKALDEEKNTACFTVEKYSENWYDKKIEPNHPAWSYLKISEGCNNRCSYCSVPSIRGNLRSAPLETVLKQACGFIERGVKELVIIAEDTTAYGLDKGENLLPELLLRLSEIDSDFWIRVLYAHPMRLSDELIPAITETPKVVPYLDIPIQHISETILSAMGRNITGREIRDRVRKIRDRKPNIALRTSVIVGFPGETDEDFEELLEFIEEGHFIHGGVFEYSKEEGTPAIQLENWIPKNVVEARKNLIELAFDEIRKKSNEQLIGKKVPVLIERETSRKDLQWGRSIYDAPEIDRAVRIRGNAGVGEIVDVQIIKGVEDNLIGVQE